MRWKGSYTKLVKVVKSDQGGVYYDKFDKNGQNLGPFAKLIQYRGICA